MGKFENSINKDLSKTSSLFIDFLAQGVLTNRALFGRGNQWYLLAKYQPMKKLAAYLKYSETYRDDVDVIGSGADQIIGNLDRRVSLQLEMKL